jgi:hypothetical protein
MSEKTPVKGYRNLTEAELALINEGKELAAMIRDIRRLLVRALVRASQHGLNDGCEQRLKNALDALEESP